MSTRPILIHPAALTEATEAKGFYLARDVEVALVFEGLLSDALERIEQAPERWPPYLHDTRRYILPRYPYAIIYEVLSEHVRVLAIAHQRRRPGYWARRKKTGR